MTQTAQWHEDRAKGIGGSDCAAALGLSKWKTPYQLWLEKTGEAAPIEDNWAMAHGRIVEPLLRQHYADTTGNNVLLPQSSMVSERYPYMRYNPDGISENRLVEFKTAAYGREWGEAGTDEIPQAYILQCQHGMIVTGLEVCDVTVSIGGGKPKYFIVEADREIQEMIIEAEAAFWHKVENRIEPDPISNEDVAQRYSKVNGQSIAINAEIAAQLIALRDIRAAMKNMEAQKESLEVAIKHYIGENEVLTGEDGFTPLVTWKQRKGSKRIDSDLLKKELPDIAEKYSKIGAASRTFLIK